MATIGNLIVKLSAHTKSFRGGMMKAEGVTRRFQGVVQGMGKAAKAGIAAASAAIIAGTAVMAARVKQQMQSIDETAKLADRIGTTTEDLIGLRHAAELTGAGADSLDAGLQTLAKRLGEAARGSGAAKPALEELGLSAARLAAMNPAEAFREIAERLKGIEEPGRRAAIAANLFSKANMSLLNTLDLGKEGLAAAADEAERLGMMYSRIDAGKVERANDAMTRLGSAFDALGMRIAVDLADDIERLADMVANSLAPAAHEVVRAFKWVQLQVTKVLAAVVQSFADWEGWDFFSGTFKIEPIDLGQKEYAEELAKTVKRLEEDLANFDKPAFKSPEPKPPVPEPDIPEPSAPQGRRSGPDFAAVLERGSREAYSAILRHRFGGNDPNKETRQISRAQLERLGRIQGVLEQMRNRQTAGPQAANLGA